LSESKVNYPYFKPTQDILYHYTDYIALENILKTKVLHFSNILCLNDVSEYEHGVKKYFEYLKELMGKEKGDKHEIIFTRQIMNCAKDIYVFCLSTEKDLLSQWRGYTSQKLGISIGFDTVKLEELSIRNDLLFSGCVYNEETIKSMCIDVFKEIIRQKDIGEIEKEGTIETAIGSFAIITKNNAFVEEKEFRVAVQPNPIGIKIKRDTKMNEERIISHASVDIENCLPYLIREVVVGPVQNQNEVEVAVNILLNNYGIKGFKVTKSNIPYRGRL